MEEVFNAFQRIQYRRIQYKNSEISDDDAILAKNVKVLKNMLDK